MTKTRYLTKSRFKLACECPAKLFYTGKSEYANQKLDDSFLAALADGGFQVGELAKCYFPGGHDITTLDHLQALEQTNQLLKQDEVVIYEAAVAYENLFIRADVLVKNGRKLSLYEVKAKSFDPQKENPFLNKNGSIKADWKTYLYDIAFQKYVINMAWPEYEVEAQLMMADKSSRCPTDGLNQKFKLIKDATGRKSVKVSSSLNDDDLAVPVLCRVNVEAECEQIYEGTDDKNKHLRSFNERVGLFADKYTADEKIESPVSTECANCEFYTKDVDEAAGLKSGLKECWTRQLGWSNDDFNDQTVLDIWAFTKKKNLIADGRIKMSEITEDDVAPKSDGRPGVSASERRWMQVSKYKAGDSTTWFDRENMKVEMERWIFPLHFIDFETTMAAIPFNAGRRPYEGIAFQFSHHMVYKEGTVEHFGEYLNTKQGFFPNYEFVRQLKAQLEHDRGSIFRYSNHENTYLNMIYNQLKNDQNEIEDRAELCDFIRSITKSTQKSDSQWTGERNMIDLWELVKRFYYDPATNGSNSIKYVLPAILNSSEYLQEKYSKPIYGAADGIKSHNYKDWQWIKMENGLASDPYKLLPKMFQDITQKDMRLLSSDDELREGGAALTAYARMQFAEMSDYERKEIRKALLKYCELDTMAMVMIYEGWREML